MKHPSYLLNPGDMFQVDPERVLTATGRPKPSPEKLEERAKQIAQKYGAEAFKAAPEESSEAKAKAEEEVKEELDEDARQADEVESLRAIVERAKSVITKQADTISGKRKVAVRALIQDVKEAMKQANNKKNTRETPEAVVDHLSSMLDRLELSPAELKAKEEAGESSEKVDQSLSKEEREELAKELRQELNNPYDPSKPYLTPWRPRQFMAPFAHIPRYLEVNQNICAAVYLRHPVARQGMSEVPTPFPSEINQLAFNWYLRRG